MTNNKKEVSPSLHKWRFFRSGGFDQARLETGADLKALDQLDPKLCAALSWVVFQTWIPTCLAAL